MKSMAELFRLHLAETINAGDTTPMMVFPIGEWHSAKYPDLDLSEELANELIANFEAGVLGREPVVDSSGGHDTSAPAAGWVKRVYLASYEEDGVTGLALWADVKWTGLGAKLLSDEQYKYGSAEIGLVVMNTTGDEVPNVLRSLTLCNTPVLSIMPGVKDAAAKQRVLVTLSEYSLGGSPTEDPASDHGKAPDPKDDPVNGLLAEFADWHAKLKGALKGQPGNSAVHASIKACRDQLAEFCDGLKMAEAGSVEDRRQALKDALAKRFAIGDETLYVSDFGPTWAVYNTWGGPSGDHYYRVDVSDDGMGGLRFGTPVEVEAVTNYVPTKTSESTDPADRGAGLSEPDSRQPTPGAKGDEGQTHQGERDPVAPKGAVSHMKSIIKALNLALSISLAEDASEDVVLAEVTKVLAERDAVVLELAETKKAAAVAAITVRLDEAVTAQEILPAEKDAQLAKFAESPVYVEAFLDARKGHRVGPSRREEGGDPQKDRRSHLSEGKLQGDAAKALAEARSLYMAEHKLSGAKGLAEADRVLKLSRPELFTDYAAYLAEQRVGVVSGDV